MIPDQQIPPPRRGPGTSDDCPTAAQILRAAAAHIENRAQQRDTPAGERSMKRTVAGFNALTGHALTERDGWLFMVVLKAARASAGRVNLDDYEVLAAYAALAGECEAGP